MVLSTTRLPTPTRDELLAVWTSLGGSVRAVAKHYGRDRRQIYRWLVANGLRAPGPGNPIAPRQLARDAAGRGIIGA